MSAGTGDGSSSSSSSWIVPVVVAAVVVLALLVITFYVRTRKRDDQDDMDRQSDIFFEAPRSNTSNYANAAGIGGNHGMVGGVTAEERAQKEVIMAMRKESAVTAAPAAIPPASSKMRSDSVTGAQPQTRNRQDSVPILAEPRFTLQQQVELEQSQHSMRVAGVPRSPQAMTSPVGQSFELGNSFEPSYDPSHPTPGAGASVPGVTL